MKRGDKMILEMIICFTIGFLVSEIFNVIDYYYFNYMLHKRVMPNQNSIIVLDDKDTWSAHAFYIQVSDKELASIMNDEKIADVITDDLRWRPL